MANTHIPEMITHDNMLTEHNVKRKKPKLFRFQRESPRTYNPVNVLLDSLYELKRDKKTAVKTTFEL